MQLSSVLFVKKFKVHVKNCGGMEYLNPSKRIVKLNKKKAIGMWCSVASQTYINIICSYLL